METHVDVSKCTSHYDEYHVSNFLDAEKSTESGLYEVEEANEHINDLMNSGRYQDAQETANANAALIDEAFMVASETGLSPRQLVNLVRRFRTYLESNPDCQCRTGYVCEQCTLLNDSDSVTGQE